MNILITGGNGFVAQHLNKHLQHKHTVHALNSTALNCADTSVVSSFFTANNIDVVIHTALTGREKLFETDPKWLVDSLVMWRNIYQNRHKFKMLIQFGTAYELPLTQDNKNITLSNVLGCIPDSSYGYAKNLIARCCNDTENFYNLRVFGNCHYTEADIRFFKKLYNSDKFTINEDRVFDYFNLEDLLKVVEFVIDEKPAQRDINLVYEQKLYLSQQVELFCEINNINPVVDIKKSGYWLTGDPTILKSFNLKLDGLAKAFEKYSLSNIK